MIIGIRPITDHGGLTGLLDDDHTLYFKADGSRTLTGELVTSGKVIRPVADSADAIKITKADGTTSFITFDTGNRWMIGQNWTLKASQLKFGTPTADGTGIMMSGSYQFIFSDTLTAAGASASNILNNFNSYTGLLLKRSGSGTGDFIACQNSSGDNMWQLSYLGNISIIGTAAKSITVGRHTTAATAGNNLTIQAGAPKAGESNLAGGTLYLSGAISTGTGKSAVELQTATAGLISGSSDNTPTTKFKIDGNSIAFFGGTPATQQTLAAYTSDAESGAYTGIDNLQAGSVYATVADLNTLRTAYDNLRASYDDLRTKLIATTLMLSA